MIIPLLWKYCSPSCYWLEGSTITNTKLTLLNRNDSDYIWVRRRFRTMLPQAKIKGIIRLQMPKSLVDAHQKLKNQIAIQYFLPSESITHRMFHGTKTSCDPLQYITRLSPICSSGCGLCGITSKGNDTAFSRYSGQMWFANNASTSLGYCSGSNVKVMFVVDVLSPTANSILIVSQKAVSYRKLL